MNSFQLNRHVLGEDHDDPAYSTLTDQPVRPARTGEELVHCRNCDTPNYLTSSSIRLVCPGCGEEVWPRKALMDLIRLKQDMVNTLNAEIAAARTELYFRKLRNGEKFFWEQPKPAAGRPARPSRPKRPAVPAVKPVDLSGLAGQACLADLDF